MLISMLGSVLLEEVVAIAETWMIILDELLMPFDNWIDGKSVDISTEKRDNPSKILMHLPKLICDDEFEGLTDEVEDYLELGRQNRQVLGISRLHFIWWQAKNILFKFMMGRLRSISDISLPWKRISK